MASAANPLSDLARAVAMPATIHFQRRANRWFRALRVLAARSGFSPRVIAGGARYDPVDVLQQPILIDAGNLLANLHLAREIVRQHPKGIPRIIDASEDFGRMSQLCPIVEVAATTRAIPQWRVAAYRLKRTVQRSLHRGFALPNRSSQRVVAMPMAALHLADMVPEARALKDRHGIETVFVLLDGRGVERLRNEGFESVRLLPDRLKTATDFVVAKRLVRQLSSLVEDLARSEGDFDPQEVVLLKAATLQAIRSELPTVLWVADAAARLLETFSPPLVLVGNPYVLEGRLLSRIAESVGIPTAVVEHGTIFNDDPKWQDCPASLICAWGHPSRRALETCGVNPARISVTGAPRFDEIFARFADTSRPRSSRDCILVVISGPGDQTRLEHHESLIRILHEAADATPELRWVVKLHPKDRKSFYDRAQGHRLEFVEPDPNQHGLQIFELLQDARAAVTERSSAAIDAMAVGVPVISVNVWPDGKGISGIEFLERGCTRQVRTSSELAKEARRAWEGEPNPASDDAARTYAADHLVNPGTASAAVADALATLTRRKVGR